jgi:signal transduction histidine kinase
MPIESSRSVVLFGIARVVLVLVAIVLTLALGFSYEGELVALLAGLALPWTLAVLLLATRDADAAMSWPIAAGDFLALGVIALAVPEVYAFYRFVALFLVAVHAHFQGERRGLAIAAGGVAVVIGAHAIADDGPVEGDLLVFNEIFFAAAALVSAGLIGTLRTSESASRLRARELTRRTLQSESEVRRRVAESIHDGPVQELIGLDMMLAAAVKAADQGDGDRSRELLGEARSIVERNATALREEILDLGPFAFEELSYAQAVENCVHTWQRRYEIEVLLSLEELDLSPEVAGHLFRVTQEAVVNAGRHADARQVSVSLRSLVGGIELRVYDDGHGFGSIDPLGLSEPGHLGLAAMRERAELLGGTLDIETSARGT